MAYGASADAELVRQFEKVCMFCGDQDRTRMSRVASKTLVKLCWRTDPSFARYDLKLCERHVFTKLTKNRNDCIRVDGPHVEAYLTEMAHEVTKVTREEPKILRNHPYVTFCKAKLEDIVRGTVIQGYHMEPVGQKNSQVEEGRHTQEGGGPDVSEAGSKPTYPYKKPEPPRNMTKQYDLRKGMPIVIAKRGYGNFS